MPHHRFWTKKKEEAARKKRMAGPSQEVEEEMTKERKRDFSILGKIWKGYKQVREMSRPKKKKK